VYAKEIHETYIKKVDMGICNINMVLNYSMSMNSWDQLRWKHWRDYHGIVKQDQKIVFTYNNRMHSILSFKSELTYISRMRLQGCATMKTKITLYSLSLLKKNLTM